MTTVLKYSSISIHVKCGLQDFDQTSVLTSEHTMERKAIEKFPNEIDEDLVVYAPFLREKGFTSNLSIKFLKDKDLLTLGIQIPLGHKRLLQIAVAKLQTPKSKMGITPESEDEDDTRQQNDRKGLLRP